MGGITDALVVSGGSSGGTFVLHAALFHNTSGMGVVGVMLGFDSVQTYFPEKVSITAPRASVVMP